MRCSAALILILAVNQAFNFGFFVGYTLISSVNLRRLSLFAGFGQTKLRGKFIGDDGSNGAGITDTHRTESEKTTGSQFLLGASYDFDPLYFSLQMDRFKDSVYSAEVGYRF